MSCLSIKKSKSSKVTENNTNKTENNTNKQKKFRTRNHNIIKCFGCNEKYNNEYMTFCIVCGFPLCPLCLYTKCECEQ